MPSQFSNLNKIIAQKYVDGTTLTDLQQEYELSYYKVRKILKTQGVKLRNRAEVALINRRNRHSIRRRLGHEINELFLMGYSFIEIAEQVGLNRVHGPQYIIKILQDDYGHIIWEEVKEVTPEQGEIIKSLFPTHSIREIAKHLNINGKNIYIFLQKNNLLIKDD